MPFEKGNKLAVGGRKEKPWRDALMVALKDEQHGGLALRMIADRCVAQAVIGDKDARKEIADRLDGKAVQATEISGQDGGPIETAFDPRDAARAVAALLREAAGENDDGT